MSSPRPLPLVTPETAPYWTGGASNELRLPRCPACEVLHHPSMATCPTCGTDQLEHTAINGAGVVLGFSVNHQQWLPNLAPPYVVVVVALDAAPGVRLTANLVTDDVESAHVGMVVETVFEQYDDVWLPMFRATGAPDHEGVVAETKPIPRAPASKERFEHRVALTGVGISQVGRRLMRPGIGLTVEAALNAIADAGLTRDDIDGIATYPGSGYPGGMSEGGLPVIEEALRIRPTWFNGGSELPGQGGAVVEAMLAVASGLCRHVLCIRTVWEATHSDLTRRGEIKMGGGGRVAGDMQWKLPYGAMSASTWIGMAASQYFKKYGANRDVLARIALNARAGAQRNPIAVYREPLTLDDYYAARMISTPMGLYDCDVPCDGAVAIIVSHVDAADDCPNGAVRVNAVGTQITERWSWDQDTITHEPMVVGPAAHLWSRSDLQQSDVDVALLYDGFTFNCLSWIEALGFCGFGEASDFIGDGSAIALDGTLPVNPHGGQLSAGRLHGFGFLHDAMLQLRGAAGDHQVSNAQVAVVSTGGGTPGGCFLLTR